jgi:hypothetical protein
MSVQLAFFESYIFLSKNIHLYGKILLKEGAVNE